MHFYIAYVMGLVIGPKVAWDFVVFSGFSFTTSQAQTQNTAYVLHIVITLLSCP